MNNCTVLHLCIPFAKYLAAFGISQEITIVFFPIHNTT